MIRKRNSGVTQLELLISLTVMATIALLLANVLNFTRQSLERSETVSGGIDFFLVRQMLRNEVEMIDLRTHSERPSTTFIGEPQWFRVNVMSRDVAQNKHKGLSVTLETSGQILGNSLFVDWHNFGPSAGSGEQSQILASNVTAFKISYFGQGTANDHLAWYDSWPADSGIPILIKLEWHAADGRPSPPITIQPGKIELQSSMSLSSLLPPG